MPVQLPDKFYTYLKYLILAFLIYVPVFGFLDTLPIRLWDESRIAINAYEMHKDHDYIVTHCNYEHETWNTKPPLLIWCQVFFMKLIGVNEIAIRLPSAIAVFLTCMLLLFFSKRYLKSFWLGFIVVLLLITSPAYMDFHIARTGDYDALLTFFTCLSCFLFYTFSETQKIKYLYLFFIAFTCAVLTKGIAGMFFGPALAIYCISQKQLLSLLKNKHFYFGLLIFLVIVPGYYLLRDAMDPGYIKIVQENEWGGRYLVSQGGQNFDFWFYFNNIINTRLPDRYLLIPCGFIVGFFSKNSRLRKLSLFLFLLITTFFIVISSAKTQLEQYDAPLYPLLSLVIAFFIYYIFELLRNSELAAKTLSKNVLPFIFLFLIFITPYQKVFSRTYLPEENPWDAEFYEIGYYLKNAIKGKYDLHGKFLAYEGYNIHNEFYLRVLNDKGVNVQRKYMEHIKPGEILVTCQANVKNYIMNNFLYKEISSYGHIVTYEILAKRDLATE